MRETLERGKETYSPHLLTLLQNRLDKCQVTLSELRKPLANLSPELTPIHEKLVSILRSMAAANTRHKVDMSQYPPRHSVDSHLVVSCFRSRRFSRRAGGYATQLGKWQIHHRRQIRTGRTGACCRSSQQVSRLGRSRSQQVSTNTFSCQLSALTLLHRQGQIDVRFKPPYDKLIDIRNHLEKLTLTQAWSLRETDLYSYQRQLDRIDESRVNGNFLDPEGNPADLHAQRVRIILYMCKP